jgi:hypothetical protein
LAGLQPVCSTRSRAKETKAQRLTTENSFFI